MVLSVPNQLHVRLRALRQINGLSQAALAARLGLPRGTYTHYELAKRVPDLDLLMQIADLHQVSLDYLTGYTNRRPTAAEWLAEHPAVGVDRQAPLYSVDRDESGYLERIAEDDQPQT